MRISEHTENPIAALRKSKGMTQAQFSVMLGISSAQLREHESGSPRTIQKKLLTGLIGAGVDVEELSASYERWVKEETERQRERFRQG